MKDLEEVVEKVKNVEDNVNTLIIPILKDTIKDGNRHNKRLFILNLVLAISILIIALFSQTLVMIQNQQYADFLSQFEFTGETNLIQNTDDNSSINSGINYNNPH